MDGKHPNAPTATGTIAVRDSHLVAMALERNGNGAVAVSRGRGGRCRR